MKTMSFTQLSHRRKTYPLFLILLTIFPFLTSCKGDSKPGKPGTADSARKGVAVTHDSAGIAVGGGDTTLATGFTDAKPIDDSTTTYTLRVSPHVGDAYSFRVAQKAITEFMGQKATEEEVYSFTQRITGTNDDGSFTVEMRYDSIRSKKSFPPGVVDSVAKTFAYDTRLKLDTTMPEAKQAKALIGQRVNLTLSKTGEVKEISNIEPILSGMLGKARDSVPPKALEQLRAGIKLAVFQAIVQQLFLQTIPDAGVKLGQSWTRRDTVPLSLPIASVSSRSLVNYKLGEIRSLNDQKIGHVTYALSTEFPNRKMDNKDGVATLDEAAAVGKGDALIDLVTGFPVRKMTQIDVKLKITGKPKVGPNAGKSQSLSQSKSTTTIVDLLGFTAAAK
ncbi:MAG: hypothetical protein JWQ98_3476 [Chlorobi bacterium]|nr:hypothetical protein [Chlorobiota bacterium]